MAQERWISAVLIAASVASGASALAQAPALPAAAPATAAATRADDEPASAADLVEVDRSRQKERLLNGVSEAEREDAGARLISRNSPQNRAILLEALRNSSSRLAVARALGNAGVSDPEYTRLLLPMVGGEKSESDAAARALATVAQTDPEVRRQLLAMAAGSQPGNVRAGIIRALGAVGTRDAIDAIIGLLSDPKQAATVQNAAADTLIELTGQSSLGRDPAAWRAWQAANANKKDDAWRADNLAGRDARSSRNERQLIELANELKQILDEQYDRADIQTKDILVMRMLESLDARTREIGVRKVDELHQNAAHIPPRAPKRLQLLVGDSDPEVRKWAAIAINHRNDIDAVDALLTQLAQEPDAAVRRYEVEALIEMKRLRAVPLLQQLLKDPSIEVATTAVRAISAVAPLLVQRNPKLATEAGDALWSIGAERSGAPAGVEFQAVCIEAAGKLRVPGLAKKLLEFLSPQQPDRLRSSALHALADIRDPNTMFRISQWLANEQSPIVRIDALKAIAATSTFERAADTLHNYMLPTVEPDKAVRDQAWVLFESLLPYATDANVLNRWASNFQNEPARRLSVLLQLNTNLKNAFQWSDLAVSQQNTGETYMQDKDHNERYDPAKAAVQFQAALDFWQGQAVQKPVTVQLIRQLLDALVASRQYDNAANFCARQIARDPRQQDNVGPKLKDAVAKLEQDGSRANNAQLLHDATRFADAILRMQPPLAARFLEEINTSKSDAQKRLASLR